MGQTCDFNSSLFVQSCFVFQSSIILGCFDSKYFSEVKMMQYISRVPTIDKFLFLIDLRRGSIIAALYGILMCSIASPSFVIYINYFKNNHEHHIYESKFALMCLGT